MSLTYLRVKIKSLAAEAPIIRREERRLKGDDPVRTGLRGHRVTVVREEARAAQLAYALARGRTYAVTEPACTKKVPYQRVATLAARYGGDRTVDASRVKAWTEAPALAVAA